MAKRKFVAVCGADEFNKQSLSSHDHNESELSTQKMVQNAVLVVDRTVNSSCRDETAQSRSGFD